MAILVFCVGCDQATKVVAKDRLPTNETLSFAGDTFRLHYAENTGAFLSLGALLPEQVRFWLFTILAGLLLVGILIYALLDNKLSTGSIVAYGLIVGGGVGNLIDRILRDGAVVDFLNVGIGSLRTGVFNVADMAITTGVVMMLVMSFRIGNKDVEEMDRI